MALKSDLYAKVREQMEVSCYVSKLAWRDRVLSDMGWKGYVQTGPMNLCPGWDEWGVEDGSTSQTRQGKEICRHVNYQDEACV